MKNILVTGSEGFIGKNLCAFLEAKGLSVSKFDRKTHENPLPNLKGIDAVIHLGANSSTTEKDLAKIIKENFIFSVDIYRMCQENRIRFQYASSASVYGSSKDFQEEQFCIPLSPYAYSKYMFDVWLMNQKYPYQGFRYFNVYGNCEEHKGNQSSPISKFIQCAKKENKIRIFEKSDQYLRDFVSVDDVCEMHWKFLQRQGLSGVWNIGTGSPISFEHVAKIIQNKFNCEIETIPFPENLKGQYQEYTCADLNKLTKDIGEFKWKSVEEWINMNVE